jgi:hypothetical protein
VHWVFEVWFVGPGLLARSEEALSVGLAVWIACARHAALCG